MAFINGKEIYLTVMKGEKGDKGDKGEAGIGLELDEESFIAPNVIEGLEFTETAGASWQTAGGIASTEYNKGYTAINKLIDVLPNCLYLLPDFHGVVMLYDENGRNGYQLDFAQYPAEDREFATLEWVKKIGISYTTETGFNKILYRQTAIDEDLNIVSERFSLKPENIKEAETKNYIKEFATKDIEGFDVDIAAFNPLDILKDLTFTETAGASWQTAGGIASTQYTANYTAINELIDVIPGYTYLIPNYHGVIMLYSDEITKGEQLAFVDYPKADRTFTVPEGKTKIGLSYTTATKSFEGIIYRLTITDDEKKNLPRKKDSFSLQPENISGENIKKLISPLKGKVIVNFGDSIFGNARPPEDISTFLAKLTGANVYNCGFGGCRMAYHPSANYDAFSMSKIAYAIANNDFALQDAAIANTAGDSLPSYFSEALDILKGLDFSTVDIITIAYGANDLNGVPLDDSNNKFNTQTYGGALRYSIETLLSAYPNIRIFVCSQTYRFWIDSEYNFTEDSDTHKGGADYTTLDLVKKTKEVASEYKLPYIDNYHSLGINKFNRTQYFSSTDGAHHIKEGRKLIAAHIAKKLF